MKLIWRVAKTELKLLFLSPLAWILLVVFLIQAGLAFLNAYEESVRYLVLEGKIPNVTSQLFSQGGLFPAVQSKLYLYLPLLTMGLMSKELSSGTVKLLYSSPITSTQIVLGKFLSMVVYGLALMALLGVFVIFSAFTVNHFDLPMALTGMLGVFLLFCAFAAIGLFVSCLISYQVAVAVCTMAIFALLQYAGFVGQDIPLFRHITYWISISGRADEFINGLITSEDVFYFIIVILLFLLLAVIKLKANKLSKARLLNAGRYATVLFFAVCIGYLSSLPSLKVFVDNTATKTQTLTPQSQEIIKKLNGGLKVITYVNLMDPEISMRFAQPKQVLQDMEQLKRYTRFKPEMEQEYEFYYDEDSSQSHNPIPLKKRAETAAEAYRVNFKLFKSPQHIRSQVDLSNQHYKMTRQFIRDNGESTFLNFYNDVEEAPSEREISAALYVLSGDAPVIGFLKHIGSRSSKGDLKKDYKYVLNQPDYRFALANQGYKVVDLLPGQPIPNNLRVLIIADVDKPLNANTLANINSYIANGGNLLIAGDIDNQTYLNPLLSNLGVRLLPGSVVQQSENERPNLVFGQFSGTTLNILPDAKAYAGGVITMQGAVALSIDNSHGFNVSEILHSRAFGSWIKAKPLNLLDDQVTFDPTEGDKPGIFPLAVALGRKINGRDQRIFISGDADFLSNAEMQANRAGVGAANAVFATALFSWLSADKLPLKINRPIPPDKDINFSYENLGLLYWTFLGGIPALFIIAAGVILISRKRA